MTNLIYSTGVAYLAELLKQVLSDNGIESRINNNQDSTYLFGDISIYVGDNDLEKAKTLTQDFINNTKIE
ncbi:MAG: DUF2007 domain-containing protein [Flavobacteriaceae bacterium]|nr:DUF2007 domain-containing protein [Flavobacteriaceae bacterium]